MYITYYTNPYIVPFHHIVQAQPKKQSTSFSNIFQIVYNKVHACTAAFKQKKETDDANILYFSPSPFWIYTMYQPNWSHSSYNMQNDNAQAALLIYIFCCFNFFLLALIILSHACFNNLCLSCLRTPPNHSLRSY